MWYEALAIHQAPKVDLGKVSESLVLMELGEHGTPGPVDILWRRVPPLPFYARGCSLSCSSRSFVEMVAVSTI